MIGATVRADDAGTTAEAGSMFTAMASRVTLRILDPGPDAEQAIVAARERFRAIERSCTRFDASSDLMRANANARGWTHVAPECFDVLRRAYLAYRDTGGAFDPRTLESLQHMGYDRSWEHVRDEAGGVLDVRRRRATWRPGFDSGRSRVRIGPRPVDLGGIGKGIAVGQAMATLRGHGASILVEAGGDLAVKGPGPQSRGWRVRIEDPLGGDDPAAVWEVTDTAVATSSIRRRSWRAGGQQVHHLIDPRTGQPAQSGLMSVTVAHPDAATAEVWTKVGFLAGRDRIRAIFDAEAIPAVWIGDDGRVRYSKQAVPLVTWKVSRVPV